MSPASYRAAPPRVGEYNITHWLARMTNREVNTGFVTDVNDPRRSRGAERDSECARRHKNQPRSDSSESGEGFARDHGDWRHYFAVISRT